PFFRSRQRGWSVDELYFYTCGRFPVYRSCRRETAVNPPGKRTEKFMVSTNPGVCEWFVGDIRRSHLIENERLDQAVAAFLMSQPQGEPAALAQHMVEEKLLTPFQAERLLQGATPFVPAVVAPAPKPDESAPFLAHTQAVPSLSDGEVDARRKKATP